uniref:Endoplasmic reticulum-Golgi intermediate compartment protein n=1 Tax=Blastobotrys adeninivorans TaxID=409370 RepID=A0A060T3G9_BLAAD
MPCQGVTVHVVDQSGDRLLAHELLTFEPADFDSSAAHLLTESEGYDDMRGVMKKARRSKMRAHKTPVDGNACRIYGSIPVTRVRGDLHITAKGYGYRDRRVLRPEQLNFTHIIDEFSFGTYYPKLVNPLDGTVVVAENSLEHIKYFLSVVRTKYRSYSTGYTVDTNQYAVTEMKGVTNQGRLSHPPGLFFKYDMEPIALDITDRRLPFSQWLVRSVNIIGGVIVCTGSLYRLFEAACGKVLRQSRVKSGMLDKLEE